MPKQHSASQVYREKAWGGHTRKVVAPMFWFVGEEEHNDPRFSTASLGLYVRAGSWCMHEVHNRRMELPPEWEVPAWVIKGWGATRLANELIAQGIWERVPNGYVFDWIRPQNTPEALRQKRKGATNRQAVRRAR